MRGVAKTYGIPTATLARKANNPTTLNRKSDPSTVLDSNQEKEIEQWIFDRAKMGIPVTKEDLLSAVETYVTSSNKNTPFIPNRPGRHWYEGFKRRHPDLTIKKRSICRSW